MTDPSDNHTVAPGPGGSITARRATSDDGVAVGEIHAASWGAAYAPLFPEAVAQEGIESRKTRWHARLAGGEGLVMLGFVAERPLAMSWSVPSEARPGFAEIYSFYTHPDGWGSGVSAALMQATLNHLTADGFDRVHLWTLRDTPQSRRFYTKVGFTETGATQTRDFGDGTPLPQVEYELRLRP
ncbi:GNAT family N-acetyltransferase [Kribbella sp. NBC_00709]|uniref:GNAT family N-acetyltransferase n=1 Tax=Kribbella sp. NBC_00709 TaxID=2975972 RepID=UPI002E2CF6BA|nr:GNAT family N-acetyltransferase [Kribbella sp. NBC_00709]